MSTFFGSFKIISKKAEFSTRKYDFTHIQSNTELCLSNKSWSKFIKITEKFSDSDTLFFANLSKFC
jgi:predicted lipid carrier protein YhbT